MPCGHSDGTTGSTAAGCDGCSHCDPSRLRLRHQQRRWIHTSSAVGIAFLVTVTCFLPKSEGFLPIVASSSSSSVVTVSVQNRAFVDLLPYPDPIYTDEDESGDDTRTTGTTMDRLPTSYVATWPTFVLDLIVDDARTKADSAGSTGSPTPSSSPSPLSSVSWMWSRIPDDTTGTTYTADTTTATAGYVNPVTFDTVWHPVDLKPPYLQCAVGLHIRNGQVRHILPAVDIFYNNDHDHTTDDTDDTDNGVYTTATSRPITKRYRNRGLQTVPRAFQWMDFASYLAMTNLGDSTRVSCRLELLNINNNNTPHSSSSNSSCSNSSSMWTTVQHVPCIQTMVSTALTALATDPPDALGDGSCLVHVVLPVVSLPLLYDTPDQGETNNTNTANGMSDVTFCPIRSGSRIRVRLDEVVVATEADAVAFVGTVTDTVAAAAAAAVVVVGRVGTLDVNVEATAAGSESVYRPDCYTALFADVTVQRPAFVESRLRIQTAQRAVTPPTDMDE